jgi:hypothetical protein
MILLLALSGAASGTAAWLIIGGHRTIAGIAALISAIGLVGGTIAARRRGWPPGRFVEGMLDRSFDASILAPLAWVSRRGDVSVAVLALVGMGAAYVAGYERAKGSALGYRGSEGIAYRSVRTAVLVGGLLSGWVEASLWAFAALSVSAVAVRAWNVADQDQRASRNAVKRT